MKVGDYVRTKDGYIYKIEDGEEFYEDYVNVGIGTILDIDGIWVDKEHFQYVDKREIVKSSPNILELLEPMDLLYVDISPDDCGGIVVPKIPETINQLNSIKRSIATGDWVLESVVTHEQLINDMYKVGE